MIVTPPPVPEPIRFEVLLSRSWSLFRRNWVVAAPPVIAMLIGVAGAAALIGAFVAGAFVAGVVGLAPARQVHIRKEGSGCRALRRLGLDRLLSRPVPLQPDRVGERLDRVGEVVEFLPRQVVQRCRQTRDRRERSARCIRGHVRHSRPVVSRPPYPDGGSTERRHPSISM